MCVYSLWSKQEVKQRLQLRVKQSVPNVWPQKIVLAVQRQADKKEVYTLRNVQPFLRDYLGISYKYLKTFEKHFKKI